MNLQDRTVWSRLGAPLIARDRDKGHGPERRNVRPQPGEPGADLIICKGKLAVGAGARLRQINQIINKAGNRRMDGLRGWVPLILAINS